MELRVGCNVWVVLGATSCDIRESRTDNGYTDTHTDNVRWMGYTDTLIRSMNHVYMVNSQDTSTILSFNNWSLAALHDISYIC